MRPPTALDEIRRLARELMRGAPAKRAAASSGCAADDLVAAIRRRRSEDRVATTTRALGEGRGNGGAHLWLHEADDSTVALAVLQQGRPVAALISLEREKGRRLFEAYADTDGVLVDGKPLVRRKPKGGEQAVIDPAIAELFPCWRDLLVGHIDATAHVRDVAAAFCDVASGRNAAFVAIGASATAPTIAGAYLAMKAGRRAIDLFGRRVFPIVCPDERLPLAMPPILAGDAHEVRRAVRLNQARFLPTIEITGYNAESIGGDADGFLGDSASDKAFLELVEGRRKKLRRRGTDPLGDVKTEHLKNDDLDRHLDSANSRSRHFVRAAADSFGARVAAVIRAFLAWDYWRGTQRIVIGGGLASHRVGKRVIAVAGKELQRDFPALRLRGIGHASDDAALIGALHLFAPERLETFDAVLAVDIGGTKVRAGIVKTRLARHPDLSAAFVWKKRIWRHGGQGKSREKFVGRLVATLEELIGRAARHDVRLAPLVGIACPGIVDRASFIWRGTQNLPGDWAPPFNLARAIEAALPEIEGRRTRVRVHNDAVVQGLGELPFMRGVESWGIFTIGTGLGNAHFTGLRHPR
jgi:predicted NBD/HSP70 family sugar kinase